MIRTACVVIVAALVAGCAPSAAMPVARAIAPELAAPPDSATLGAADSVLVRFVTTKGDIDVMLRRPWAPLGAPRVAQLVASGFYDDARFFRAVRGFVIQWGIPADTGTGRTWRNTRLPDDTVRESNRRGTVTFAAGGKDTRTVQLFINLRDNARLDALGFAPVGEVVRGMNAVDSLHTGYGDGPTGPSQQKIGTEGGAYLAREFPLLDKVLRARVVRVFAAAR